MRFLTKTMWATLDQCLDVTESHYKSEWLTECGCKLPEYQKKFLRRLSALRARLEFWKNKWTTEDAQKELRRIKAVRKRRRVKK